MCPSLPARSDEETLHWLALRLTPGLGARRAGDLLERFGSPSAIFRASAVELQAAGLSGACANSLATGCAFDEAVEQQERLKGSGATLVTLCDAAYPSLLREIYDPPILLLAKGRLELLDTVMIAVVGSRRASVYGLTVAEKISGDLTVAGCTIVSGMAKGIDTSAHRGALGARGGTVAVFGSGLDVIYPAENRSLADQLSREGLILTEFPFGAPAHPQNFPLRNRVVSGLCAGVIVVEGVQYSGSLITARLALDQNREVYAVPGNITSKLSFGPNLLLKQGAHLVQEATDVLDALDWETRSRLARQRGERPDVQQEVIPFPRAGEGRPPEMCALDRQLIDTLSVDQPMQLDCLLEHLTVYSSSEVIAALFELELQGRVRQLPGRSYVKVWYE
jgi:DNA processing protein